MTRRPCWYLATPYTQHPRGFEAAYQDACILSAWLLQRGVEVFSPIAHSHGIAVFSSIGETDHDFWLTYDMLFVDIACGLMVAQIDGWEQSYGIGVEVMEFKRQGKPIVHLPQGEVERVLKEAKR